MGLGGFGIETNHFAQLGFGLLKFLAFDKQSGVIEARIGVARIEPNRQAIMRLSPIELSPLGKRVGEAVVRQRIIGLDADRFLPRPRRHVVVPRSRIREPQVVLRGREGGIDCNRAAQQIESSRRFGSQIHLAQIAQQ